MSAQVYHVDGTKEEIATPLRLRQCQDIVGGNIEPVHLSGNMLMIVNEDGLRLGLKPNENATAILVIDRHPHRFAPLIVGDVIVCKEADLP